MRQVSKIKIGAYYFNGAYFPFPNYPIDFDVWNISYKEVKEFVASPTKRALSGRERGGIGGFRIDITLSLDNIYGQNNTNLRNLLNKVPSQYTRVLDDTTLTASTSNTATIASNVFPTNDSLIGTFILNPSRTPNKALVTAYTGGTKVATVDRNVATWASSDAVDVALLPNLNTIIGISTNDSSANIIYCNLIGSTYGIEREFTVGNQIVNIQLRSVERFQEIPQSLQLMLT